MVLLYGFLSGCNIELKHLLLEKENYKCNAEFIMKYRVHFIASSRYSILYRLILMKGLQYRIITTIKVKNNTNKC